MDRVKRAGHFFVGNYFKVPLYVHWNFFLVCTLILIVTIQNILEGILICIIYFSLFVVHEFGHVFAAKLQKSDVHFVEISILGGVCYTSFPKNRKDAYTFITAGFVGQGLLFIIGLTYYYHYGMDIFAFFLIYINGFSFLQNLMPYKNDGFPTDGYVLYRLLKQTNIQKRTIQIS